MLPKGDKSRLTAWFIALQKSIKSMSNKSANWEVGQIIEFYYLHSKLIKLENEHMIELNKWKHILVVLIIEGLILWNWQKELEDYYLDDLLSVVRPFGRFRSISFFLNFWVRCFMMPRSWFYWCKTYWMRATSMIIPLAVSWKKSAEYQSSRS